MDCADGEKKVPRQSRSQGKKPQEAETSTVKVSTKRNGGLGTDNARVSDGEMAVHGGGIGMSTVISLGTGALLERMSLFFFFKVY